MQRKRIKLLDPEDVLELQAAEARERCYEQAMEERFVVYQGIGTTSARTKEEFYGFEAADIARAHVWKAGHGAGVFFRLNDGRVIDSAGAPHESDPTLYDQTTH